MYEGDWVTNKRHGKGKLRMIFVTPEGEKQHMVYEGQFQHDNISGKLFEISMRKLTISF